jgi:hypothetical protein
MPYDKLSVSDVGHNAADPAKPFCTSENLVEQRQTT